MFSVYMNEFGGTGRQTVDASPYRGHASEICVDSRCTLSSQKDVDIGQPNMLTATLAVVAAIAVAPITLQVSIQQAFSSSHVNELEHLCTAILTSSCSLIGLLYTYLACMSDEKGCSGVWKQNSMVSCA